MDIPQLIALFLLIVGLPWLVFLGYRRGGSIWALLILFFSIIAGLIFCILKKEGWIPWLLVVAGWSISIAHYLRFI